MRTTTVMTNSMRPCLILFSNYPLNPRTFVISSPLFVDSMTMTSLLEVMMTTTMNSTHCLLRCLFFDSLLISMSSRWMSSLYSFPRPSLGLALGFDKQLVCLKNNWWIEKLTKSILPKNQYRKLFKES